MNDRPYPRFYVPEVPKDVVYWRVDGPRCRPIYLNAGGYFQNSSYYNEASLTSVMNDYDWAIYVPTEEAVLKWGIVL